ncbi:MAG: hypothetical protein FWG50_03490 [Kiritimatiellaeota bacterium]|nr:hypothetical protein [Kiritimatiellota bacterium]
MKLKIYYNDDGYYLADEALLYDNPTMRKHYGDLIPSVEDKGMYCIFNTGADEAVSAENVTDSVQVSLRCIGRKIPVASVQTFADAIQEAASRLQRNAGNLRFPDPRQHDVLYRVLGNDRIVILYGLERYDGRQGIEAAAVAEWFQEKVGELTNAIKNWEEKMRKSESEKKHPQYPAT